MPVRRLRLPRRGELVFQYRLGARFVGEWAVAEAGRVGFQVDRPAGEDIREGRDIGLGVAGLRADGVQFHALAGEVFVQAAMGFQADRAVGAERPGIVEIQQHRRVAHDRQHHVAELAGDVGADGFLDEGGGNGGARTLAPGNGEVVGPEPDQAFAERGRSRDRVGQLGGGLRLEQGRDTGFAGRWLCLTIFMQRRQPLGGGRRIIQPCGIGLVNLIQQPSCWVGRQRFGATAAKAEPHESLSGADVHGRHCSSVTCYRMCKRV
jgi:hypothetical protein